MLCLSTRRSRRLFGRATLGAAVCLSWLAAARAEVVDNSSAQRLFAGGDDNGQLEVFKVGPDGDVCHRWRNATDGAWSAWSSLGGSVYPDIAIAAGADGRLEVFAVDRATRALDCV